MGTGQIEKVDGHWHCYLNGAAPQLFYAQHPDIEVQLTGYGEMLLFNDNIFAEFIKFRKALPDNIEVAGLALKYFSQSVMRPKEGDVHRMCDNVWMLSPEYLAAYHSWRAPHQIAAWKHRDMEED